jgi:hypothetical protein
MKTYVIRLLDFDSYATAREKLSWSRSQRTLLVWPDNKNIINKKVELNLLLRYSQALGTHLAVVSNDAAVIGNSRELGISVFSTVREAQRKTWKTEPKKGIFRNKYRQWVWKKFQLFQKTSVKRKPYAGHPKSSWILCGLGITAFLALLLIFIPSAEIKLDVQEGEQQLNISVWANPETKTPNITGGMPARQVSTIQEGTESSPASGSMVLPLSTARGSIVFINLTDNPIEIPAGTIVMTLGDPPIRFITEKSVTLAKNRDETEETPIKAVNPGRGGNIEPGEINAVEGPLGLLLRVENLDATTGGTDRYVKTPSYEDYQRLREKMMIDLMDTAKNGLLLDLQPGEKIIEGTVSLKKVFEEIVTPVVGQPGDLMTVTLRAEIDAWVFNENDLMLVTTMAMNANLQEGFQPIDEPKINASSDISIQQNRQVGWDVSAVRKIRPKVDMRDLALSIIGRQPDDVKRWLVEKISLENPAEVIIKPLFWPFLPLFPHQIQFDLR